MHPMALRQPQADRFYPPSVAAIESWAEAEQIPPDEARRRLLQTAMIRCVLDDSALADGIVLQGAAALRLFYGLPRRSTDLDYTLRLPRKGEAAPPTGSDFEARVRVALHRGLRRRTRGLSMAPAGHPDALKVDVFLIPDLLPTIGLEIDDPMLPGRPRTLSVARPEQLLSNKLHAALSARWRPHRDRSKDLWDIAWISHHLRPDPGVTAEALHSKLSSEGRDAPLQSLVADDLLQRPSRRYLHAVAPTVWAGDLDPLDEVWASFQRLLHRLGD